MDRPHPRRLVHATNVPWIDLRSTGDGHVYFTNESDPALVAMMTPDHEPASCQIEGAIDAGNIQFGYVNAAAAAATWLIGHCEINRRFERECRASCLENSSFRR